MPKSRVRLEIERNRRILDLTLSLGSKRDEQAGLGRAAPRHSVVGLSIPLHLFAHNQGNMLSALRRTDRADELRAVEAVYRSNSSGPRCGSTRPAPNWRFCAAAGEVSINEDRTAYVVPLLAGVVESVAAHWGFRDPGTTTGTAEEIRPVFATVCREIKTPWTFPQPATGEIGVAT